MSTTDDERFSALFAATNRDLLAYAVRRVSDPADAADVVAETYLVAWRRIAEVPREGRARPWLFGVARRVLANHHRGERRRSALADRLRAQLGEVVPPADAGLQGRSDVELALAGLDENDQEILRLVAWEELARDEIAVVLGLSRAAVRVRLHRARRRLAERLTLITSGDEPASGDARKRSRRTGHVMSEWASARSGVEEAR
ncbi:RNA polymerase sigma factor [Myceligenerans pegani]|uniref:Sigma-70 family RNA polymerase sigma factor n=1 Tax=Myceligenerans pegani TaxID=2776917 RepID=A0ABR9MTF4_9MICO|nr:sigma-70 family RNA polymerase sigma factor [Myceligenerans sp. TRM 65318]MBE1874663.1 sigma-70 family RNA polymerase sigma factor [Myceligenerans sp. TRM 65318]MBE3016934.1 sigma-70 family RNA polymerase sigma factor [Myceligenerans sp. TRM 65318]